MVKGRHTGLRNGLKSGLIHGSRNGLSRGLFSFDVTIQDSATGIPVTVDSSGAIAVPVALGSASTATATSQSARALTLPVALGSSSTATATSQSAGAVVNPIALGSASSTVAQVVADSAGAIVVPIVLGSASTATATSQSAGAVVNPIALGSESATMQVETLALLARFVGSYSSTQKNNLDALIAGLKTDGLWTTIDTLKVVAGATALADELLNWKGNTFNSAIVGSLTRYPGRGVTGFTTSNYITDGFVPSSAGGNFTQNSATIAIYNLGDGQSSNIAIGGNTAGNAIIAQLILRDSSNRMSGALNASGSYTSANNTVTTAVGLSGNVRTSSTAVALYRNASQITTASSTSTGNLSVGLNTGTQNNNGTPASADANLAWVAEVKAAGWNGTQFANFYNRLNTYLQTLKQNSYTFTYSSNGDSNGLFFFLGTNAYSQPWSNPAQNSNSSTNYTNNFHVTFSASAIASGTINQLTDRNTGTFLTSNAANSSIQFDLGAGRSLACNTYLIRSQNSSTDLLRSWKLQGSNDGTSWTDIDIRTNDSTLNAANAWGAFTCNQAAASNPYRYFRILNTGVTSSGTNTLGAGELEFYGTYTISSPTTFTFGANGDQSGILYHLGWTASPLSWANNWVNPHASGVITISASAVGGGNTVTMLCDRTQSNFFTSNTANSWVQIDFGASRTVRVDGYQLRHYLSSADLLRNWKIQGSNDASNWTDLDNRVNDTTLTAASQYGYWAVNQGNTNFWRYVRLLQNGLNGSAGNLLAIAEIELFGAIA